LTFLELTAFCQNELGAKKHIHKGAKDQKKLNLTREESIAWHKNDYFNPKLNQITIHKLCVPSR